MGFQCYSCLRWASHAPSLFSLPGADFFFLKGNSLLTETKLLSAYGIPGYKGGIGRGSQVSA